jgi:23S rRNA (adenine2503-C2)-methyltransferase
VNDLRRLLPAELDGVIGELGEASYRSAQILTGVWKHCAPDLDAITTLPASLRARLAAAGYGLGEDAAIAEVASADGTTTKLLLRLGTGTLIETVLMQYPGAGDRHPRSTVCVSTQAGCAMGCVFCATGQMGFERNLAAEEIVAQVLHVQRLLRARGEHVTNVVFMGMGEPLANYAETIRAVRLLVDRRTFGLAQRAITISTVGLPHAIERLAAEGLQVGLAISLHAAENSLRRRLVPTASERSVEALVAAAQLYRERTGRRVTFEYALLAGENDSDEAARALARLLRGHDVHVNLIPVNPTAGGFQRPPRQRVLAFERVLRESGIATTVRVEKGVEIAAACGQLRTDTAAVRAGGPVPVHGRRQGAAARVPARAR